MENKEMERKIKSAFEHATPDILDSVIEDFGNEEGKVIPMTKKSNKWLKRSLAIAAAFAVVITGAFAFGTYRTNHAIASTIALDVNPGVEIKVNKNNVVKEVVPLNDDGVRIVDNMDFAGSKLDVALHALVGSMVKNGYLSDITNSILVSVEGKDEAKNAELQTYVATEIDKILGGNNVSGAVLSQTVAEDTEVEKLADEYGISIGKAQIVNEIAKENAQYKVADLAKLSINELNLLSEGKGQHIDKVTATGTASSKGYIGAEKAKAIAFEKAGVKEANVKDLEVDLDLEDGVMVYEVDFDTTSYEFEYDINATTGKIIKETKEPKASVTEDKSKNKKTETTKSTQEATSSSYIGTSKAKSIALNKAGVKAANATFERVELEKDDGVMYYEVDFKTSSYEYEYKIHAVSGKVVEADKERIEKDDDDDDDDRSATTANKNNTTTTNYIGKSKAKSIALNKAGVKAADARDMSVEFDDDDGVKVYEVSFETSKYEYDYTINAKSGKILESEREPRDD